MRPLARLFALPPPSASCTRRPCGVAPCAHARQLRSRLAPASEVVPLVAAFADLLREVLQRRFLRVRRACVCVGGARVPATDRPAARCSRQCIVDLGRPAAASSGQRAAGRRGDAESPAMTPEPASMAQDQQEPAAPPRAASRTSGNLKRCVVAVARGGVFIRHTARQSICLAPSRFPSPPAAPRLIGRLLTGRRWLRKPSISTRARRR